MDKIDENDVIFFTAPLNFELVNKAKAKRKVFYFVKGHEDLKEMIASGIGIFANSSNKDSEAKRRYRISPFKVYGGIDLKLYNAPRPFEPRDPNTPFTIIVYGRSSKRTRALNM